MSNHLSGVNVIMVSNKESKLIKPHSQSHMIVLLVMIAVASGFFGGFFGARANDISSGTNSVIIQREILESEGNLVSTVAKEVGPGVVSVNVTRISVSQGFFGFEQPIESQSAGTGVILNKEGLIITNRHVVPSESTDVTVTLSDGTELEVDVIGRTSSSDPLDVAFLKIKNVEGLDLHPAVLGDSSKVEVGDRVVAIGNALGQFQNTVTSGIISGFGRDIEASDGNSLEPLLNLFQTDAAINGGNSGGPLVNSASEVIAINVATAQADNISFAIPINDIKGLIEIVLEEGELIRPYLGVRYIPITDDISFDLGLSVKRGAYIPEGSLNSPSILPGSPAEKAGLMSEDVIIEIDGVKLNEDNSIVSLLGSKRVGSRISLKVIRAEEELTIEVTLEAAPEQ